MLAYFRLFGILLRLPTHSDLPELHSDSERWLGTSCRLRQRGGCAATEAVGRGLEHHCKCTRRLTQGKNSFKKKQKEATTRLIGCVFALLARFW